LENQEIKPSLHQKRSSIRTATTALGILSLFIAFATYQLHRAETGRSNCLPHALRHFIASRDLKAANGAQYESVRLRDYMKAASLDGDDFPEVWSYLCDFYSKNYEWAAARISCERAVESSGETASSLSKLAWVLENLRSYSIAGKIYVRAAHLNSADSNLQERAIWMFLAAQDYDQALTLTSNLIAYEHNVDEKKAHVMLGFVYAELGNKAQADAAYAISFPDLRQSSCSLKNDSDRQLELVCSGVSKRNDRKESNSIRSGNP
jgi:tetratricopeptide (TPR) repeat protein